MVLSPTSDDVGPVVGRHRPCAYLPLTDIATQALIFGVLMTCFCGATGCISNGGSVDVVGGRVMRTYLPPANGPRHRPQSLR
jgi:hypothetical protein